MLFIKVFSKRSLRQVLWYLSFLYVIFLFWIFSYICCRNRRFHKSYGQIMYQIILNYWIIYKKQLRIPSLEEYLNICKRYHMKPVIEIKQKMKKDTIIQRNKNCNKWWCFVERVRRMISQSLNCGIVIFIEKYRKRKQKKNNIRFRIWG